VSDLAAAEAKCWGRWATLGLGVVAALIAQIPGLIACFFRYGTDLAQWGAIGSDSIAVILTVCLSTPVQVALLALFARRTGMTVANYLGLTIPRKREVALVLGVVAIVIAADYGLSWLGGQDIAPPFQRNIIQSASAAGALPGLFLTIVVVAPIGEETLFRGFLFRGWNRSSADAWFAIVATAALWTALHVQYDVFVLAQVFALGLVLGWIRWKTGSTVPTILLHMLLNGASVIETFVSPSV
jgi:membrane protease YdiL (CAAX protease family)